LNGVEIIEPNSENFSMILKGIYLEKTRAKGGFRNRIL